MARPCCAGRPGILHGAETYVLQDEDGQIATPGRSPPGSIIPAVGPEHAHLKDSGRAEYVGATDAEALAAFVALAGVEGIICAFESRHALAHALKLPSGGGRQPCCSSTCRAAATRTWPRRSAAGARMSRYAAMFERLGGEAKARSAPS
jgi:tryptophan synthase beta subunit